MLEKTYQPAEIEPRIASEWEKAEAFKSGRADRAKAEPYSIVIPPPNVTGSLHMGHALNNTLQDVLVRFERMRGRDVLWQPGTDHAGIATQMVVERQLMEHQQPDRRTLGREEFVRRVWAWKAESGSTIVNQLKRLGASCDWSRERFTMDDGLSRAVIKVFVELHRQGLIYKDKRLVNWDPKFQTAISDLEVIQVEKRGSFTWTSGDPEKPFDAKALAKVLDRDPNGHLYYFRYPLKDDPSKFIVVATTRPETMLGDTGVAVHPEDERYQALVGKMIILPLVGREIPIVADEYSDPEKGTGAVKITPAHDFNDFEVGRRHDLAKINILDAFGRIVAGPFKYKDYDELIKRPDLPDLLGTLGGAPDSQSSANDIPVNLQGLDRFKARLEVVAQMAALGLLEKIEPTTQAVPHGDRSHVAIEPWLTDQWYVNAGELAKPALAAVKAGKTRFVPERFANDYYRWLENIQPWCISRQLWWGHQIPAWYGPDGKVFVAADEAEAKTQAKKHYGKEEPLTRDEDVLDTWFSSALWPFSTLGWPDDTKEVARYYPTSALVTGFDIIFFWVARMMMMGTHFMKEVPFRDVYIHGLVRDAQGNKMSKTRGNVIDPLDIIDGIDLKSLIAKRTAGLNKEAANRVEKELRKEYPDGIEPFGTDALRFTMAAMAAQGSDVKLSIERIKGYRNFATKIWNAARFAEQNECVRDPNFDPKSVKLTLNRWMVGETERAAAAVTEALEAYKFNEAATTVYEFIWGVFCDWYLELIKSILAGDEEIEKIETRATVAWVLDQCLKLLHPFMPFITEELWAHMVEHGVARYNLLTLSTWPTLKGLADNAADEEIGWVVKLVSDVRSVRTEMNIPAGAKIPMIISGADDITIARARTHEETIKRLARLDSITFLPSAPKGSALIVIDEATVALPLEGVIDMDAERKRLKKEIDKVESDLGKAEAWLANESNVAKSPEHVVALNRERVAEGTDRIARLKAALKRIEA